jgi:predicted deacylase
MLWLAKALFIVARSRRGRKLLITAGVAAAELAQSERARTLYAKALSRVDQQTMARTARRVAQAIRP